MFSRSPVTITLIVLNSLVFFATYLFAGTFGEPQWTTTLLKFGAEFNPYTLNGEWYRIFTHMFLHGHVVHLLVNMLALFSVGREIEASVGSVKFILVYFVCGIGAALASLYWSFFTIGVGASGAIFGLFGFSVALSVILGRRDGRPVMPILINLVIFIFINVAVGEAFHADHAAHFGGLITGGLLAACSYYLHKGIETIRIEYAFLAIFVVLFFALPRYQVTYYNFFRQIVRAENEGKAMSARKLSDEQYMVHLQNNNLQWDSARSLLRAHTYVPEKLVGDTSTLSHYIHYRKLENDYKVRMIRDETYILMDSLEIIQDSIRKYLDIEHPIPVNLENNNLLSEGETTETPQAENPGELTRVWYDSNWVEIEVPGTYYRLGHRDSIQRWQGPVRDYYADGKIQMKGSYKDGKRHGIFLYYSNHDTYTSAGRYVDNRSVGKWQTFHDNGRLKTEVIYGNGVFYKNSWDSAGAPQIVNGKGTVTEYFASGKKKLEGVYDNGNKQGFWTGWHENGGIHFKEQFRDGALIYGKARSLQGHEYMYDASTLVPRPQGGLKKLEEYLTRAVETSGLKDNGVVRLSFRVTAQGVLADFEVDKSLSPEADKEAIEIVRDGPSWTPALLHGYQPADGYAWVDVKFSQAIEL
jgi:membrane associated rhomboid family serine protease